MQPGQLHRVPVIGLDPISRAPGNQRGGHDRAMMAGRQHLPLNAVSARSRLVADVELDARLAEQLRQRSRGVGDLAMLANLRALAPSATAIAIVSL
jgi:hypothetical protein